MHAISCRRRGRGIQALGLLAALSPAAPGASAADLGVHVSAWGYPESGAFDLHVVREDLEADYDDGADAETLRLRRLGISFYEALGDSSRAGVRLGRIGLGQSGRAATEGFDPVGYYAELDFAGAWPADGRLQAAFGASWRYASVSDSDETTEVEIDWETLELRPALRLALTPRVALALGASAIEVDGSERVRAATRRTTDFSADESGGAFLELDYLPARDDRISLRLRGGNPEGLSLTFAHRY